MAKIVAKDYVCWEDSRSVYSGIVIIHAKVCYPKGYSDDAEGTASLKRLVDELLNEADTDIGSLTKNFWREMLNDTNIYLSDGTYYCVSLTSVDDCMTDKMGRIIVARGNRLWESGSPAEIIYDDTLTGYNIFYDEYQRLCKKYLDML